MQELFAAIGEAWADAGHDDLRSHIMAIEVPDEHSCGSGVPQHLAQDYANALRNLTCSAQLKQAIEANGDQLTWSEGSFKMPTGFRGRFSFVELAGPKGMVKSRTVSFGLYLQAASTDYPSHWHEAVEHYLVLSGVADWQMDDAPFVQRLPGQAFVHASNQRHATRTNANPVLALWFWQGNISDSTYRIVGVDYESHDSVQSGDK